MTDEEGCDLAVSLKYNHHLERISLEGNHLGPRFLRYISKTLRTNTSLRYLDLEGNYLTRGDDKGIHKLCKALKLNTTLNILNLNNTQLTKESGRMLDEMLDTNKKLIMIDIEKNPQIQYETVRSIQDKLARNKKMNLDERKREWKERKELKAEEENIRLISKARLDEIQTVHRIQREAREIQLKREQIYVESIKQQEEDRKKLEKKIEKEALIRAKTKKKRPAKKK